MDKYIELFIEEILSKSNSSAEPITWEDVDIDDVLPKDVEYSHEEIEYQEEKSDELLSKHFEEVERYIAGDGLQRIGQVVELFREQFPPKDKLKKKHKKAIVAAFLEMLQTHHITLYFPKKLPIDFQYELVVDTLEEEIFVSEYGFVTIDYCSGDTELCRFAEFCSCLEYESSQESDKTNDNINDDDDFELPF